MKYLNLFLVLAFIFITGPIFAKKAPCQADPRSGLRTQKSTSPEYEIKGNTLKTLGFTFELKNAMQVLNDKEEPFYVLLYRSPNKKMAVLSLGSGETREPYRDLWLIDFARKKTELLDEGGGSFTTVFWHRNDLFEVSWGGMGYKMSVVFKLWKTLQEAHIDDLFDIDLKREIYAAMDQENSPGGEYLEVGSLFNKDIPKEKFPLPQVDDVAEYLAHLLKVEIVGKKVVICFDKSKDEENVERLIFYPKMLK